MNFLNDQASSAMSVSLGGQVGGDNIHLLANNQIAVYTGTDLHILDSNGQESGMFSSGSWTRQVAGAADTVVIREDMTVYFVKTDGTLKKRVSIGGGTGLSIVNNLVLVGAYKDSMYERGIQIFDLDGNKIAFLPTNGYFFDAKPLTDGTIVAGCSDGMVYYLNSNGTLKDSISAGTKLLSLDVKADDSVVVLSETGYMQNAIYWLTLTH